MTDKPGWERYSLWLALAVSAVLSLPYLIALQDFFFTDDWIHLSYNRGISPWQIWRYFSPQVIWFYRPLQSLQFGWLYHMVGLRPLAYNLCLLAMHLGVCLLVYVLAGHLTTRRMALLTTALFAAQWLCSDEMVWRSNCNTLHWALMTLGLCILFLRWLESRRRLFLAGVYGLFLLDLFTKESAVVAPLLLGALWWWHSSSEVGPPSPRPRLLEGARLVGPFAVMATIYLGLHALLVHDVYQGYIVPDYRFVPPLRALRQTLFSVNYVLLSFYRDPVVLPLLPPLQAAVRYLVEHVLVLPLLLGGVAWRCRDRMLGLGLLWIFLTLIPTVWLTAFQMSRFFYLPAVGAALILARAAQWCSRCAAAHRPSRRLFCLALPVGLTYLAIANVSTVTLLCLQDRDDSRLLRSAFRALQAEAHRLPHGSLVVLVHPPEPYFANGMGLTEMVRLGLDDPAAQGIVHGMALPASVTRRLRRSPAVYVLDFAQHPLVLHSVFNAGRMARRPD